MNFPETIRLTCLGAELLNLDVVLRRDDVLIGYVCGDFQKWTAGALQLLQLELGRLVAEYFSISVGNVTVTACLVDSRKGFNDFFDSDWLS
jgi:hypothetical protein